MTTFHSDALQKLHAYRRSFMEKNNMAPRFISVVMMERLGIDVRDLLDTPLAKTCEGKWKPVGIRVLGMDIVDSIPGFTFAGYPFNLTEKVFEEEVGKKSA